MSRKNGRREGRRKTMVDKKTDFGIDMINDVYSGGGIVTLSNPIKTSQQPAGQSSSGSFGLSFSLKVLNDRMRLDLMPQYFQHRTISQYISLN